MSLYDVLAVINQVNAAVQTLGQSVLAVNSNIAQMSASTPKGARNQKVRDEQLAQLRELLEGPYGSYISEFEESVRLEHTFTGNLKNDQIARSARLKQEAQRVGIDPALLEAFRHMIEESMGLGGRTNPNLRGRGNGNANVATNSSLAAQTTEIATTTEEHANRVIQTLSESFKKEIAAASAKTTKTVEDSKCKTSPADEGRKLNIARLTGILK